VGSASEKFTPLSIHKHIANNTDENVPHMKTLTLKKNRNTNTHDKDLTVTSIMVSRNRKP
jgi:hypothetical protein